MPMPVHQTKCISEEKENEASSQALGVDKFVGFWVGAGVPNTTHVWLVDAVCSECVRLCLHAGM